MAERAQIWLITDALQMDLRAANAKLAELRSQLAALNLPDGRPECPACGYRSAMNMASVAEHIELRHPELQAV